MKKQLLQVLNARQLVGKRAKIFMQRMVLAAIVAANVSMNVNVAVAGNSVGDYGKSYTAAITLGATSDAGTAKTELSASILTMHTDNLGTCYTLTENSFDEAKHTITYYSETEKIGTIAVDTVTYSNILNAYNKNYKYVEVSNAQADAQFSSTIINQTYTNLKAAAEAGNGNITITGEGTTENPYKISSQDTVTTVNGEGLAIVNAQEGKEHNYTVSVSETAVNAAVKEQVDEAKAAAVGEAAENLATAIAMQKTIDAVQDKALKDNNTNISNLTNIVNEMYSNETIDQKIKNVSVDGSNLDISNNTSITDLKTKVEDNTSQITENTLAIAAETTAREAADAELEKAGEQAIEKSIVRDTTLQTNIDKEASAREAADNDIKQTIVDNAAKWSQDTVTTISGDKNIKVSDDGNYNYSLTLSDVLYVKDIQFTDGKSKSGQGSVADQLTEINDNIYYLGQDIGDVQNIITQNQETWSQDTVTTVNGEGLAIVSVQEGDEHNYTVSVSKTAVNAAVKDQVDEAKAAAVGEAAENLATAIAMQKTIDAVQNQALEGAKTVQAGVDAVQDKALKDNNTNISNLTNIVNEMYSNETIDQKIKNVSVDGSNLDISNNTSITDLKTKVEDNTSQITENTLAIASETTAREAADAELEKAGEQAIKKSIARDTTLQTNIDQEASAREVADNALSQRIYDNSARIDKVGAGAAALAAMHPQAMRKGESQVLVGVGNYKGKTAFALGGAWQPDKNVMVNAGVSNAAGEVMVNAGLSYKFGQKSYTAAELQALNSGDGVPLYVAEMNAALESKNYQIQALQIAVEQANEDNVKMQAELAALKAMVESLVAK